MSEFWTLHLLGCGTAAYWLLRTLAARESAVRDLRRVTFTDVSKVRKHNQATCPGFDKSLWGRFKCMALPELVREDLPPTCRVESYPMPVERIDWTEFLPSPDLRQGKDTVIAILLDNWSSRLVALEDVRRRVAEVVEGTADHLLIATVGLDKSAAQVCTFTADHEAHCPMCWLPSLPASEPCVVLDEHEELLRGNLHRESQAAAEFLLRIVDDHRRHRPNEWVNTRSHLLLPTADEPDGSIKTRPGKRMAGCKGPHHSDTPIRWDAILRPPEISFLRG